MFPLSIRMNILTLFSVFVVTLAYEQERQIISKLNPGCSTCTSSETLVYIKAVGSDDTVHQVWDFTRGIPTIIFAIGTVNSSLMISWDSMTPKKFVMTETPRYSFAAAIDKLYEYDDLNDFGNIDPDYPKQSYSLTHVAWRRNETDFNKEEAIVKMVGKFPDRRGSLEVTLDLVPFRDYAANLPHLIHTANSTLVDVSLVNLTTNPHYNASRFALHVVLASTDDETDTMHYAMRKSLDDEHTPGVFEIVEIKTPESYRSADGGFIQFRPVAYRQRERGVTTSTLAHVSSFNRTHLPSRSTLEYFYAHSNKLLVQDMFVSFGESGDGYYKQHNFTAWSFTIGYGAPPLESFSVFVILIISIGLGVPVLLALSGVVFVLLRKYSSRNTPARFTDDE